MLAKEMFLKKIKLFSFFLFTFLLINNNLIAKEKKNKIFDYLKSINNFSASFIQNNLSDISEGKIYIGENRLRIEYQKPSKIIIVLANNKAMYYNYDLDEDEFFDPRNTYASFFYDIFQNPIFLKDAKVSSKDNELIIEKEIIFDNEKSIMKIYFEENPFVLRKIKVLFENNPLEISLNNHKFNEEFDVEFFKLINPKFFNR